MWESGSRTGEKCKLLYSTDTENLKLNLVVSYQPATPIAYVKTAKDWIDTINKSTKAICFTSRL